jgi:hypothetical protein
VIIPIKVTAINRLWHRFVFGKAALSAISADLAAHVKKSQKIEPPTLIGGPLA